MEFGNTNSNILSECFLLFPALAGGFFTTRIIWETLFFFCCCICNWTLYDLDQNGDKCESFNISAFYFLFRAQSMPHSLLCFCFFFFPRRNVSIRRLATIYSLLVIQLHFFWTQLFIYKMEMIFQCYNK